MTDSTVATITKHAKLFIHENRNHCELYGISLLYNNATYVHVLLFSGSVGIYVPITLEYFEIHSLCQIVTLHSW